jgi:twitching motility protein PilT
MAHALDPESGHPDIGVLLAGLVEIDGSDLCVKVGSPPLMRVDGELRHAGGSEKPLTQGDTLSILHAILPDARLTEFESEHEVDFAYSVANVARFRVNAYMQRGSVSMVFRVVPYAIHRLDELGLPDVVGELAAEERGIILVTGTSGCGKSTTLAAIIEQINHSAHKHIVTIEDPIEFLYRDDKAAIDQREVGTDTASFATALRRVLRQDPDVILIGELRDEATIRTAMSAAETGHLVLATVHTVDAAETINRILDFFPPAEQQHARSMLAGTLKAIISQRLVPRAGGTGRIAIAEVLTMTGRVHDMILNPERTVDLADVIAEGDYYGMQTFDQGLLRALQSGDISMEDARHYASRPHDFALLVAASKQTVTASRSPMPEPSRAS